MRTPTHCAASSNSVEVLKLLIDKGADIHFLDKFKRAPIHLAAQWNNNV